MSPLAKMLAGLGGGAVGPRVATAAALPFNQQAAAMGMAPPPGQRPGLLPAAGPAGPGMLPQAGGGMSPWT
jgi:hypothetical protein